MTGGQVLGMLQTAKIQLEAIILKFLHESSLNEQEYWHPYKSVQIHYWCTALMWKIVKMPVADWLPYSATLYINVGIGLSKLSELYQ